MSMGDRVGRARLYAVAAKNTARIVDVVDLRIPLASRDPFLRSIFGCLDVDAVRRACRGAQKAADALLQPTLIAMQYMNSAVARLKIHWSGRIVLRHRLFKHRFERDAESLHQR